MSAPRADPVRRSGCDRCSRMGRTKAAVFPVPVGACDQIAPLPRDGDHVALHGGGRPNPSLTPRRSACGNSNDSNDGPRGSASWPASAGRPGREGSEGSPAGRRGRRRNRRAE